MTVSSPQSPADRAAFRHEAFVYAGERGFMEGILPFLREGIGADEPSLAVLSAARIALLRSALGADADRVAFADMAEVGANPARIIPAWRDFLDANTNGGRPVRGIGEPIWPGRGGAELTECHRHEALLNVAFADAPAFWLVCPYDADGLDPDVVANARRTHPAVCDGHGCAASTDYPGLDAHAGPFADPLPEPAVVPLELSFDVGSLGAVRDLIAEHATRCGLSIDRTHDLLLAVNEVAANSVRHGGGHGRLRLWEQDGAAVCEVRDRGRIKDPLVGRQRPEPGQIGGYGVWMANQVCDLVQIRSLPTGAVVRLHVRAG